MKQPVIVVVAFNRYDPLKRLLFSLSNAVFDEFPMLIISIDGGAPGEIVEIARGFEWAGEKRIIEHEESLGLKNHILFCGSLTKEYDGVIILEDDLFVSPYFYDYTRDALSFYANEESVAGISLYQYEYIEGVDLPFKPVNNGWDTYFIQTASSWGQAWNRRQWNDFLKWYRENEIWDEKDTRLPTDVLRWPETSWKKYFIKYLVDTNKFFAYPHISLATNFGDAGTNNGFDNSLHQVNILAGRKNWNFASVHVAVKYDVHFNLMNIDSLRISDTLADKTPDYSMHPIELDFIMGLAPVENYSRKKKDIGYRSAFNLSDLRIRHIQNELPPLRKQIWEQLKYRIKRKFGIRK